MIQNSTKLGFTLVEVLVAMAMLAIIAASVVGLLPTIVRTNQQAELEQDVTVEAKAFFEDISASVAPGDIEVSSGAVGGVPIPPDCAADVSVTDPLVTLTLTCGDVEMVSVYGLEP